jgi:succinate dehydrogenase / fumarate reductase flavoprotein subunit
MLIYPTLHYQNGGITINSNGETEVPNLYAAGEAAGGIHGINRLMGNSLLDITVFGRIAGKNAAEKAKQTQPGELTLKHLEKFHEELEKAGAGDGRVSPILLPDYVGKIG